MIIYNVTLRVDNSIVTEWLEWMKAEHMPAVMATGLFTEKRLARLLEQDELEGVTFVAQYCCNGLTEYNTYISQYSQQLRDESFRKFGDKFIAFRTLMEAEN